MTRGSNERCFRRDVTAHGLLAVEVYLSVQDGLALGGQGGGVVVLGEEVGVHRRGEGEFRVRHLVLLGRETKGEGVRMI